MRLSKNYEQALYVLLILATQKNNSALKSATLSNILHVSDSSLKKILRKLVVSDFIVSTASKDGGFQLKRAITDINLADVLVAIEGEPLIDFHLTHLAREFFPHEAHTIESEDVVIAALTRGTQAFAAELQAVTLSELLEAETLEHNFIDWETYVAKK